jgi:ornithine decarboxylase
MSSYIYDITHLDRAHKEWFQDIKPFYAVKCNPNLRILKHLKELGCGFDCASRHEIETVLSLGVSPDDIIYANPCKKNQDVQWARDNRITLTTFDSLSELTKLGGFKCILRIRCDDPNARCVLGNKFGASESLWLSLIQEARSLNINLVGVSFHIGSGSDSQSAHQTGISLSLKCIKIMEEYGYEPKIIDIGGGFTYGKLPRLILPKGYTVIAEPGRYFAEHVATLYTPIIGTKNGSITIDESLYGSFNCILYDHAKPVPVLQDDQHGERFLTHVFGCTCDGIDKIGVFELPILNIGDVLVWKNMGAYTSAATTTFNGMTFHTDSSSKL